MRKITVKKGHEKVKIVVIAKDTFGGQFYKRSVSRGEAA